MISTARHLAPGFLSSPLAVSPWYRLPGYLPVRKNQGEAGKFNLSMSHVIVDR
jgi:hypothetical protein